MIRGSMIGKRSKGFSFSTFKVTDANGLAVAACRDLAVGKNNGVILIGPVGVGKTHLLVALAREFDRRHSFIPSKKEDHEDMVSVPPAMELIASAAQEDSEESLSVPSLSQDEIERHVHIEYWAILDLVSELRTAAMEGDQSISRRCRECDLLVIDDLGREKISDFILQELQRIIDWRYREILPIAVSTNLKKSDISLRYDEHTASRWLGSCKVVEIAGPDYRVQSPHGLK